MLTASSSNICNRRRFFQPMQQSASASAEPGKNGLGLRRRVDDVVEVEIVSVVEAAAPIGVTVAGEKPHVAPVGNPEQLNDVV